jgi:hypothetical protein
MEGDRRLDRIEQKIDKLSEVVISMAHVEEKLANLEEHQSLILEKIYDADTRHFEMDRRVSSSEITIKVINRIFWILVTALITGAVGSYLLAS